MPTLETSRLRLEPLSASHAQSLYAIYCEPNVRRWLITCPSSRLEFDRLFATAIHFGETHGMWAIIHRASSVMIGRVGFFAFGESQRPELAFLLSEPFWGRGLATEAASASLAYGFERHGWGEAVAIVRPANQAAIRVLTKLGMQPEYETVLGSAPAMVYQVASRT